MAVAVVVSDPDATAGRVLARQLEDAAGDIAVRAVVASTDDAVVAAADLLPDAVLLTVAGDCDVTPAVRRLRAGSPAVRVLLLTAGAAAAGRRAFPAMRAGASLAMPRCASPEAHVAAIREVVADRLLLPPAFARTVKAELDRFQPGLLTALEDRILAAVGGGLGVADVAAELGFSDHVVWRLVRGIRSKLEVADRVGVLREAPGPTRFAVPTVFLRADDRAVVRSVYAGGTGERGGPRRGGAAG